MTVGETLKVAAADLPFYKDSGGGVTCSGGEPLAQPDFVTAFFAEARARGIPTALDTAGNVKFSAFKQVLPYTDLVLFDFKCADGAQHQQGTGVPNERIRENLRKVAADGAVPVWIRVPVVPGFNDTPEQMEAIREALEGLDGVKRLELLPYHGLGGSKYESLGYQYGHKGLKPPPQERMEALARVLLGQGWPVFVSSVQVTA
jgi:pyruvate formate lyase activating enzyme